MFFINDKTNKTTFIFSENAVSIIWNTIIKLLNDSSNKKSKFATKNDMS